MTNDISGSDKLKSALCYIPLVWVIIFFVEKEKSTYLLKHIKYWIILLIVFIILTLILWIVMLFIFQPLLWLWYVWISIYLWYKAYNWEWVDIEFIDENDVITKIFQGKNNNWIRKEESEEVIDWEESKVKTNNIIVDKVVHWAGKFAQWAKNKVNENYDDEWDEEENNKNRKTKS